MSNSFHPVDTSKCTIISEPKDILSVLKATSRKQRKTRVTIPPKLKSQKSFHDFFIFTSFDEKGFLIFEKTEKPTINIKTGIQLDFLIEAEAIAYFFSIRVSKFLQMPNKFSITTTLPIKLYKINRRNYFRYMPSPEYPIPVEFKHNGKEYDFYVHDISGGGLSIKLTQEEIVPFKVGEIFNEISIFFINATVSSLSGKILRIAEIKTTTDEVYFLLGIQFENLPSSTQDRIVRNIFLEHREFLNKIQDDTF